jgi:hypothetical protein
LSPPFRLENDPGVDWFQAILLNEVERKRAAEAHYEALAARFCAEGGPRDIETRRFGMYDPVLRGDLGGRDLSRPASDRNRRDQKRQADNQGNAELTTRHGLNLTVGQCVMAKIRRHIRTFAHKSLRSSGAAWAPRALSSPARRPAECGAPGRQPFS